ncbi:MAG TPA: hypothetical protein DDX84_07430 [Nitrospiraceae bacterium]|nr:MAG: hypothetical protein A2Z60_01015 [Nitrospirae bacterium RIFCSPLOWO2_02_42_7]HBI24015.1 hypothetical protein [Nitrospiraceae bacterium]
MEATKHRTQISIEDWQYQILLEVSRKTKKSLSSLIRDLLTEKFSKQTMSTKEDSIWGIIGIGAGDGSSVAREHDRFLLFL